MTVRVITDSTSHVLESDRAELGIGVVQMSVTYGGVTRDEDDIDTAALCCDMRESREFPTSAQPSVAAMVAAIEAPVAAGDEVVGVFLSSEVSGAVTNALMARKQILERRPDARIAIVDARSFSMEEGFAALAAGRAAAAGATLEETVAAAERVIPRTRWLVVPRSFEYLRLGGRVGLVHSALADGLQIRPVLAVENGVTVLLRQVRTSDRALGLIADLAAADFSRHGFVDGVVHHIGPEGPAAGLAGMLEERSGVRLRLHPLKSVVGVHVGLGSLGLVYQTRDELDKTKKDVL